MANKTADKAVEAREICGVSITVGGLTIHVPRHVEVQGGEAVEQYITEECAKRGVKYPPAPVAKVTTEAATEPEPTAPAPTSNKKRSRNDRTSEDVTNVGS